MNSKRGSKESARKSRKYKNNNFEAEIEEEIWTAPSSHLSIAFAHWR